MNIQTHEGSGRFRRAVEDEIERLIAMLDSMEPDPDLEPWLGSGDDREDQCEDEGAQCEGEGDWNELEPTMGWQEQGSQAHLHATYNDECEEENEHGGDIQDVPHDAVDEGNDEPFLGWAETCGQGPKIGIDATPNDIDPDPQDYGGGLRFDGDGCLAGREVLRNLRSARPDVRQEYVGGWCDGNRAALKVDGLTITGTMPRNPTLAPDLYPDHFSMIGDGNCCEPVIADGGRILVDKGRPYAPGDFVVIFRDPATVKRGDHVMKVKRLVWQTDDAYVVEMLNPPTRIVYPRKDVLAVWFCEPAPADYVPGPRVTDRQLANRGYLEARNALRKNLGKPPLGAVRH